MVDLIPKQQQKPLFGQWFFTIAAFLLMCGVIGGFLVLDFLKQNEDQILVEIEAGLAQQVIPQEEALKKELLEYKEKIDRFAMAAARREDFLKFLTMLEKSTHPDVVFEVFAVKREDPVIEAKGQATGFFVLEQQRLLWEDESDIAAVTITDMELQQTGGVKFSVEFIFNDQPVVTP